MFFVVSILLCPIWCATCTSEAPEAISSEAHTWRSSCVHHGLTAFSYDRKTEASLLSHATDLDQLLSDRYPDERLADEFRQSYRDAQAALRRKAHADS